MVNKVYIEGKCPINAAPVSLNELSSQYNFG